jgi:hypothetical protein
VDEESNRRRRQGQRQNEKGSEAVILSELHPEAPNGWRRGTTSGSSINRLAEELRHVRRFDREDGAVVAAKRPRREPEAVTFSCLTNGDNVINNIG